MKKYQTTTLILLIIIASVIIAAGNLNNDTFELVNTIRINEYEDIDLCFDQTVFIEPDFETCITIDKQELSSLKKKTMIKAHQRFKVYNYLSDVPLNLLCFIKVEK